MKARGGRGMWKVRSCEEVRGGSLAANDVEAEAGRTGGAVARRKYRVRVLPRQPAGQVTKH